MTSHWIRLAITLLASSFALTCAADPLIPLFADFNDKMPGAAIGIGGAEVGEPVDTAGLTTTVSQVAGGQNVLVVANQMPNTSARRLHWQLLGNAGVGHGKLVFAFTFVPSARDSYSFLVREPNSGAQSFLNIALGANGGITASDQVGQINTPTRTYAANVSQRWVFEFDLDTGTSSVVLNEVALFTQRAHGITAESIGRLFIGYSTFADGSSFRLDDLHAMHEQRGQLLLDADIEGTPLGEPIGTGGAALGEPIEISTRLVTEVGSDGASGRWLRYSSTDSATGNFITWQFRNNREVTSGQLFVSWDMRLPALDGYDYAFREAGGSSQSFPSLRLTSTGQVRLTQSGGSSVVVAGISYVADRTYRVRYAFDFSTRTYDALLDNRVLAASRPFAITTTRGIGRFLTGFLNQSSINQPAILDNLEVRIGAQFVDGFEP